MTLIKALLLCLIILAGCAPNAQLFTVETNNNNLFENDFVYRDSLVRISYEFYLSDGFLTFKIENLHDEPIYIDWKNSMYIPSPSKQYSYWIDETSIKGTSIGQELYWTNWLNTSRHRMKATAIKPDRISFLPPDTEIFVKRFRMVRRFIEMDDPEERIEQASWKPSKKEVKVYRQRYSYDDTPINFRNYLSISLTEDFKNAIYYNFEFWVSEIQMMPAGHVIGDRFFETYSDSVNTPGLHPYKSQNRFFVFDKCYICDY